MDTATLTEDQIHGRACRHCGTTEQPLHADEEITTPAGPDVVRDTVTTVCTPCLVWPK